MLDSSSTTNCSTVLLLAELPLFLLSSLAVFPSIGSTTFQFFCFYVPFIIIIVIFAKLMNREQPTKTEGRSEYEKDLEDVKNSLYYKQIQSVSSGKGGLQKVFTYHYAQQKRWHLGSGSYGEVYCCFFSEIVTGRVHKFALKIIQVPSSIGEVKKIEDTVATTRQEIKSLIKLRQNQNIIKIQDVIGEEHNRIYLILEYCNNKDLQSFFISQRKRGLLHSEEEVLFYFKQLLNGFQDLYKYNIIHRDIKPANIFVHNNILKIGDFGLSQQLFQKKENLHDHRTIGTLLTSAPQLIFKEPYTNKCDIYSLGLTLYWMLFEKFPFQNIDCFDKEQLLKQSLNFDHDSIIRPSPELAHLLKSMLAYKEDDRIDWQDLFNHSLFQYIKGPQIYQIRESIGRNLQGQNVSMILESTIPAEFYLYLGQQNQLQMTELLEATATEKATAQSFMKIFKQGINFKFRLHFFKLLLRQVQELSHSEKIKNKIQFSIIKDLLRLGIDKFIVYLNDRFLNELNGYNTLHVLDIAILDELSCSKCLRSYVERFALEAETYQNSHKKPKPSKQQLQNLDRNCKAYEITDKFHLILGKKLLVKDERQFLQQIKRCIVELTYFVKEQIRYYSHQEPNLSESEFSRYRQLVLLVHHLNMFILQEKIFPRCFDKDVNYDTENFNRYEMYQSKNTFLKLARQINDIISRFQN